MALRISRELVAHILRLAAARSDREICGLLLGQGDWATAIREAANVADDPACRFEVDPAVLIAAHRAQRGGGAAVIGHYHSHPGGDVRPSACDAAMAAADGALWLICTPAGDHALWRAGESGLHGRFLAEPMLVESDVGDNRTETAGRSNASAPGQRG